LLTGRTDCIIDFDLLFAIGYFCLHLPLFLFFSLIALIPCLIFMIQSSLLRWLAKCSPDFRARLIHFSDPARVFSLCSFEQYLDRICSDPKLF